MDLGLTGRWALVSGASQGIGEGLAEAFASEGVNLHLTARSADRLRDLQKRLQDRTGVTVHVHPMDLAQSGAVERLVDAIGDIDILVNNARLHPWGKP